MIVRIDDVKIPRAVTCHVGRAVHLNLRGRAAVAAKAGRAATGKGCNQSGGRTDLADAVVRAVADIKIAV